MIPIKLVQSEPIHITVITPEPIPFQLSAEIVQKVVMDEYEGAYEFTPSEEQQTIPIASKTATQDITIGAIPINYGRLDWEAGSLKVY